MTRPSFGPIAPAIIGTALAVAALSFFPAMAWLCRLIAR